MKIYFGHIHYMSTNFQNICRSYYEKFRSRYWQENIFPLTKQTKNDYQLSGFIHWIKILVIPVRSNMSHFQAFGRKTSMDAQTTTTLIIRNHHLKRTNKMNRGIKHDFPFINIRKVPRKC